MSLFTPKPNNFFILIINFSKIHFFIKKEIFITSIMTDDNNIMGNASTIAVWVWVFISPYIAEYITQDQFTVLFTALVGLCIAVYSSYNPNTFKFLHNDKDCTCPASNEQVLNDEYEVSPNDDGGC